MLSRLEKNGFCSLIENASLEFREGFTVMTGETGAGKSILIDAIGAVCGERNNRDIVRTGKEVASVTAVFDDPDKVSVNLLLSEIRCYTRGCFTYRYKGDNVFRKDRCKDSTADRVRFLY
jgi:DNA repair protein RecN (Recombination protein N)